MQRRLTTAIVLASALVLLAGRSARADVCVVVNPVVDFGACNEQSKPPRPPPGNAAPASSQTATSYAPTVPDDPEPVRRSSTELRYDPRRLAVTFEPGTSREAIRRAISDAGGTLEEAIPKINAYLVGVEPDQRAEALASLRSSSLVASASQDLLAEAFDTNPDDNEWPQQVGLRVAGFPAAWDVTRGSSRIVVAVIDTGVDGQHPDLRGALVPGYDFVNNDSDPTDDYGHGTAVAGIIAARSNNRAGGAGICWRCAVMPIKVLDATGSGNDTVIAAGIVWATDHGAQVINLSLGGPGSSPELSNAMGYAAGKGVAIVAAAGNAGTTAQFFPAADARALSVAATTVGDRRYTWSNFGPWVRVTAPGCNIAPLLGDGYGTFCGTSSSAPLVAGLIALELSAEPTATAQEAEQALVSAAFPLPEIVQYGRINAGRTLSLLRPAPLPAAVTRAAVVFRGTIGPRVRMRTFQLPVGAGAVTATLRYIGGERLALSLSSAPDDKPIARVVGLSPLQLTSTPAAGTLRFRITCGARTKAAFVLRVSYAKKGS